MLLSISKKKKQTEAEKRGQRCSHLCKALLAPSGRAADSSVIIVEAKKTSRLRVPGLDWGERGSGGSRVSTQSRVEDRGGRLEVVPAGQSQSVTDGQVNKGQIKSRKAADSMM